MSDRYEIRGKLGKGGMSAVYRAFDSVMGREVAIKRLLPLEETNLNEAAGNVLASEAAALARFQHPNIVTVYAFEEDEDGPYVVMELVDGEDLHQVLQGGALSLEDFQDIAVQCLEPLVNASELNLLHRDIKPGNIMLTMTASERFLVKILDFGLAKFSQQPSTQTLDQAGSFLGSIDYIAPEQLELMPLDQRTDLYSLGCVLYYALAQKAPFTGDNPAVTSMNHLNHSVVPISSLRPDVPEAIANWLMRMIARDPHDRPGNALEALQLFRLAEEGQVGEPAAVAAPLTGGVKPDFAPAETATGVVLPPGETPPAPVSEPVKRPVINTSPQIPRPRRTVAVEVAPSVPPVQSGWEDRLRHPVTFAAGGVVLLGILFFFLFGRGGKKVEVAVIEDPPRVETLPPEVKTPPGKSKFLMPETLLLEGQPAPLASLPADPPFFQRFAGAEGLFDVDLTPATEAGGDVAVWVNLKTRGKSHSLFPLFVDEFAEVIPVSRIITATHIPSLKSPTRAVTFNARSSLVTRTGPIALQNGFTLFLVGKLNSGSGRQIRLEPNDGGGAVASVKIDFSGDVVGSTRVGGGLKEAAIKAPWQSPNAGVIGYASSPGAGRHHLVSLATSADQPSLASGEYAATPSPFQRLFLGQNAMNADPEGAHATWMFEVVLYDRVLSPEKMTEIAEQLSDFYFTRP